MNASIRKVAIFLAVLMMALFVNLNYVQVVKGSDYRDDARNNRVQLNEYASPRGPIVVQGADIAKSVATSDELKYLREYPGAAEEYAAVTGWYSYIYGSRGIEDAEDSVLSGNDNRLFGSRLADILTGRNPRGGSVDLTLNRAAQHAAYTALTQSSSGQPRRGAVVALDPTTGAILAAVSSPSFDPNLLSSHRSSTINHAYGCYNDIAYPVRGSTESATEFAARTARSVRVQLALREGGTQLLASKHAGNPTAYPLSGYVYDTDDDGVETRTLESFADQQFPSFGAHGCGDVKDDPTRMFAADPSVAGPLHNRVFSERYPPGSTFKVVVAAAALRAGKTPSDKVESPVSFYPDGDPQGRLTTQQPCRAGDTSCLENFNGEQCQPGSRFATLTLAFAKSCNTTFAMLATQDLGGRKLAAEAELFGFDAPTQLTTPLPVSPSTIGSGSDLTARGFLARTAFGQQSVAMTPIQGAMLAAAVANNSGSLMKPYLVAKEVGPDLKTVDETKPDQLSQVLDPSQVGNLQSLMYAVVNDPEGTGQSARVDDPNIVTYGKTGTADNGDVGAKNAPHAWFTGYAKSTDGTPRIAVCVILENAGVQGDEVTGGEAAAPVAKAVMEAYLKDQGDN